MPTCSSCHTRLEAPASGNVVTCPSCWRTNVLVHREESPVPAAAGCPACEARRLAPEPRRAATMPELLPQIGRAVAMLAGWLGWMAWQSALLLAAILAFIESETALRALAVARLSEPQIVDSYVKTLPWLAGALVYLVLLEISLNLHGWHGRISGCGQSVGTVALMAWHRLLLGVWRGVTLSIAAFTAGTLLFSLWGSVRSDERVAVGFVALLVFLFLGFTRLSAFIYAAMLIGGITGIYDSFTRLGDATDVKWAIGPKTFTYAVDHGLLAGTVLAAAGLLLLYAEMVASRRWGHCRHCSAYVPHDEEACVRCSRRWDETSRPSLPRQQGGRRGRQDGAGGRD